MLNERESQLITSSKRLMKQLVTLSSPQGQTLFEAPKFVFNLDLATCRVAKNQIGLLKNVIKLAEYFINYEESRSVISNKFKVTPDNFARVPIIFVNKQFDTTKFVFFVLRIY